EFNAPACSFTSSRAEIVIRQKTKPFRNLKIFNVSSLSCLPNSKNALARKPYRKFFTDVKLVIKMKNLAATTTAESLSVSSLDVPSIQSHNSFRINISQFHSSLFQPVRRGDILASSTFGVRCSVFDVPLSPAPVVPNRARSCLFYRPPTPKPHESTT
ncbi:MAG TPA: hypothetical protein VHC44_16930, partial [Verrucomicrobiae bacterium]|nr:hypothetical protein [Verrucomicrobiae bacterium]